MKWISRLTSVTVAAISLTCSCSRSASAPVAGAVEVTEQTANAPAVQRPAATSETVKAGLSAAFALPLVVAASAYESRSMVAEAVYYATAVSGAAQFGRIMSTGTVLVTPAGTQYLPSPTDRLVVRLGEQTHEFVVKQAQGGNQAPTATGWLQSPHILQYTHRIPDNAEAEISEQFDGQRFTGKITGWAKLNGQRFEVDLAAAGQVGGERDLSGQDVQTVYDLTGAIRGNGSEVKVNQHQTIRTVGAYSLDLLYSQRGTATQINAVISNSLQSEGQTYTFTNVQVQSEFTEKGGNTTKSGVTAASGAILRAGQPFATLTLQNGTVVAVTGSEAIVIGGGR